MSISSNLNSFCSVIIILTDFSGENCPAEKRTLFFPYTPNEGDDDIGSNSISKIPNGSTILRVFEETYFASIMMHIDFAYFSTRCVIWISSDSFKIMLSSFNLPFRSSIICWMTLQSFATSRIFDFYLLMAGEILSVNGRWNSICQWQASCLKRFTKLCQTWKNVCHYEKGAQKPVVTDLFQQTTCCRARRVVILHFL